MRVTANLHLRRLRAPGVYICFVSVSPRDALSFLKYAATIHSTNIHSVLHYSRDGTDSATYNARANSFNHFSTTAP